MLTFDLPGSLVALLPACMPQLWYDFLSLQISEKSSEQNILGIIVWLIMRITRGITIGLIMGLIKRIIIGIILGIAAGIIMGIIMIAPATSVRVTRLHVTRSRRAKLALPSPFYT